MTLRDVWSKDDFAKLYAQEHITTTQEAVDYLLKRMGVYATHGKPDDPKDYLTLLEDYCLQAWDRVIHGGDKHDSTACDL